jgi:hypothetical protein
MRNLVIAAFVTAGLIANYSLASAETMTPQQYHKDKGPCACPDDMDKAGHKCGKRSAFCRPGGVDVQCFRTGDIAQRKKDACG